MPTLTITTTAAQATRFVSAVGKFLNLVDTQTPPQPRVATADEARQCVIRMMRNLVLEQETIASRKAALDAITTTPFDPT